MPTPPKVAGVYIRQSEFREESLSLDMQQTQGIAYAAMRGFPDHRVYRDQDISGRTGSREGLDRLIVDVKAGLVGAVVVYKVDRFFRSLRHFTNTMQVLDDHGVALIAVTQPFDTSNSMGRMVMSILATFAQFESETLGERVRDTMRAATMRGQWTGGRPPRGYFGVDGRLVPSDEADQVLECFRAVLAGESTRRIAIRLGMSVGNASEMLRNPVYLGRMPLGRARWKGVGVDVDSLPLGEHPAIVPADLWHAVQAELSRRATHGPKLLHGENVYVGRIHCAVCGSPVTRYGNRTQGNWQYKCSKARELHACEQRVGLSETKLHAAVLQQLRWMEANHGEVRQLVALASAERRKQTEPLRRALTSERRKLRTLDTQAERLTSRLRDADVGEFVGRELRKAQLETRDCQARIYDLEAQILTAERAEVDAQVLAAQCGDAARRWEAATTQQRRDICAGLGLRITWDGERLVLDFPSVAVVPLGQGSRTERNYTPADADRVSFSVSVEKWARATDPGSPLSSR